MAHLAQVTKITRKLLLITALVIGGLIILRIVFGVGVNLKEMFFPTPPPPPSVLFGTLPKISLPTSDNKDSLAGLSFTVDTATATLPQFPNQIKVYKLPKNKPSLLSLEQAQKTVASIGFSQNGRALTKTLYQWKDEDEDGRIIKFDIVDKTFDLTSNFFQNEDVLLAKNLPNKTDAQQQALSFLARLNLAPQDLDPEKTVVTFFTIEGASLIQTTSLSSAQLVRVDLFQKAIDKMPIIYKQPDKSSINFLIGSSGGSSSEIVEARFRYQAVDEAEFSTYPLKTAEAAFGELKKGDAYLARFEDKTKKEIGIQTVSLGFYMDEESMAYLMPIFIFEGSGGLLAYVSAIDDSWITP